MPAPRPLDQFSKNWHSWLRRGPQPTRKFWGQSIQRGRVCACVKLSPSGVYFFSLFKVPCASLQVGPLDRSSPLTAQMTRPRGVYVLFMVSLIKKIFSPIFHPKMWKIALHPMGNLNSYNFGTVEDTIQAVCTKPGVFGVAQSNGVIPIYPRLTLVATATNRIYFNTKLAITRLK